jgi:Tfp pilus tip-associated adhesin PilY1
VERERDNVTLRLYTDFIATDSIDAAPGQPLTDDMTGAPSTLFDALQTAGCGDAHPFSAGGWESNYDGTFSSVPPFVVPEANLDPISAAAPCSPANPAGCVSVKHTTDLSGPLGPITTTRPLDRGDLLPLSWDDDQKAEFLTRLAPSDPGLKFDYRVARYFKDEPDPGQNYLELRDATQQPLVGLGHSPLSKAVADFRCWYLGDGNKCRTSFYDPGWEALAASRDEAWGCRKPYLIVISDGLDNCGGENPCADTANLFAKATIRTWVVAYGANCAAAGNPLKCMAQNGKGELVCPQDPTQLEQELRAIIGQIKEDITTFASAAVPSVQTSAGQSVYLTSFQPVVDRVPWAGHLDAYLKPVPTDLQGRAVNTPVCNATVQSGCFLWDAREQLLQQAAPTDPITGLLLSSDLNLGPGANERRVFFSQLRPAASPTGTWAQGRRLFDHQTLAEAASERYDFWHALGTLPATFPVDDALLLNAANGVVDATLAVKYDTLVNGTPIQWVLGEIFHSNPLVIGPPNNAVYFTQDIGSNARPCADGNPGYRCFAFKHQFRRRVLLAGANDGMAHAFDAGIFEVRGVLDAERTAANAATDPDDRYTNGTGREIFGYLPRVTLPTVRRMATATSHLYGVDGTVVVADARIDPVHDGTPTPAQREWRTVAIGGLREGGESYYALDITQPDELDSRSVPQSGSGYVPSCLGTPLDANSAVPAATCGPAPYPAVLWEWNDTVRVPNASTPMGFDLVGLDEDRNGKKDHAASWSIPNMGRIRVCTNPGASCRLNVDRTEDRYVAVFGGGLDKDGLRGNYLYFVDIETGETLYKRLVEGSSPAEPSAVDTDQDGYLDRVYFGTTAGYLYRADIGPWPDPTDPTTLLVAGLETRAGWARDLQGNDHDVTRVFQANWEPRKIFDSGDREFRAVYFRPSVLFVAKLGRYALAWGTGDREDLWTLSNNMEGRFYVMVDDSDVIRAATGSWPAPRTEANLQLVQVSTVLSPPTLSNYLLDRANGNRGWYLQLSAKERLISSPFGLSGILFFSTYNPTTTGNVQTGCSYTGKSNVFVVQTENANPLLLPVGSTTTPPQTSWVRKKEIGTFVTEAYTEQGQSKNPAGGGSDICSAAEMQLLMQQLKSLFPQRCDFANYRVDVKTIGSDTTNWCVAPVPVCLIEKNWKDF